MRKHKIRTSQSEFLNQENITLQTGPPSPKTLEATDAREIETDSAAPESESSSSISPENDPNFQALNQRVEAGAQSQASHEAPTSLSSSAQAAALSPSNERGSRAQAKQVEKMDQEEPVEFDAASFKKIITRANSSGTS